MLRGLVVLRRHGFISYLFKTPPRLIICTHVNSNEGLSRYQNVDTVMKRTGSTPHISSLVRKSCIVCRIMCNIMYIKKKKKAVNEDRWTDTRSYFPKCTCVYTVFPQYSCKEFFLHHQRTHTNPQTSAFHPLTDTSGKN